MKNKNKIPRKFYRITGEVLEKTTAELNAGDILHVYKNDFGYLALVINTGVYYYIPVGILRPAQYFKITEIIA